MKHSKSISLLLLLLALTLTASKLPAETSDEQEIFSVLDDFMTSFSESDPIGHAATYHVPHFRLARGDMSNWEKIEDVITAHERIFRNLSETDWHHSEWIERKLIGLTDTKAHIATTVGRFREDGSQIVIFESLYILIKKDGRWGIKFRSSYL